MAEGEETSKCNPDKEAPSLLAPPLPLSRSEFLASFQFSQGSNGLQLELFRYLHAVRPDARLSAEGREALFSLCQAQAHAIVEREERHAEVDIDIDAELRLVINALGKALAEPPLPIEQLIEHIAIDILAQDQYYYRQGGRRRAHSATSPRHYNPHADCWLSHTIYFALEGHTTGSELYDKLFHAIGAWWKSLPTNHPLRPDLDEVWRTYRRRHPRPRKPRRTQR